jgi:hypothetical protein
LTSSAASSPIPADDDSLGVGLLLDTASESSETRVEMGDTSSLQDLHEDHDFEVELQATLSEPVKTNHRSSSSPENGMSQRFKAGSFQTGKKILGEVNVERTADPARETATIIYGNQRTHFTANYLSSGYDEDITLQAKRSLGGLTKNTNGEERHKVSYQPFWCPLYSRVLISFQVLLVQWLKYWYK